MPPYAAFHLSSLFAIVPVSKGVSSPQRVKHIMAMAISLNMLSIKINNQISKLNGIKVNRCPSAKIA